MTRVLKTMPLRRTLLIGSVLAAVSGIAIWLLADLRWGLALLVCGIAVAGMSLPLSEPSGSDHPHDSGGPGQMGGSLGL